MVATSFVAGYGHARPIGGMDLGEKPISTKPYAQAAAPVPSFARQGPSGQKVVRRLGAKARG